MCCGVITASRALPMRVIAENDPCGQRSIYVMPPSRAIFQLSCWSGIPLLMIVCAITGGAPDSDVSSGVAFDTSTTSFCVTSSLAQPARQSVAVRISASANPLFFMVVLSFHRGQCAFNFSPSIIPDNLRFCLNS